jgi:hypothetical protein
MEWIPLERRKRGRPRKTWMEGAQAAMTTRNLEPDQWRHREEWFNHFLHQLMHLYIYYQSLKQFVHLIAPTCFDTERVIIRELYFPGLSHWLKI